MTGRKCRVSVSLLTGSCLCVCGVCACRNWPERSRAGPRRWSRWKTIISFSRRRWIMVTTRLRRNWRQHNNSEWFILYLLTISHSMPQPHVLMFSVGAWASVFVPISDETFGFLRQVPTGPAGDQWGATDSSQQPCVCIYHSSQPPVSHRGNFLTSLHLIFTL